MNKLVLFANEYCPYCQRVITALNDSSVEFEFILTPMNRSMRGQTKYEGERDDLKDKTMQEIFAENLSIPKAIDPKGNLLLDSHAIIEYINSLP